MLYIALVLNATILRRARQQLEESNRIENAIYNLMGGKAANVADSKSNMNAGKDQSYSSMNSSVSNLGHLSKADQVDMKNVTSFNVVSVLLGAVSFCALVFLMHCVYVSR